MIEPSKQHVFYLRIFTIDWRKTKIIHLTESYGDQGRKDLEVPRQKYGGTKMWDQVSKNKTEY